MALGRMDNSVKLSCTSAMAKAVIVRTVRESQLCSLARFDGHLKLAY